MRYPVLFADQPGRKEKKAGRQAEMQADKKARRKQDRKRQAGKGRHAGKHSLKENLYLSIRISATIHTPRCQALVTHTEQLDYPPHSSTLRHP